MQLDELRAAPVRTAPAVQFVPAAASAPVSAPVFEVSPSSGIPDDLLAEARTAAQAAGYAAGWASGIRAARVVADAERQAARASADRAETERQARVQQAFTALDLAAGALEARAVPGAEQVEELIVTAALAIAEELVGHALQDDVVRSQAALRRALSLAPADDDVTVRLNPADYASLCSADGPPESLVPQGIARRFALVEDASIAPGDAVAGCGATEIDARISTGLARVREVLRR